MHEVKVHWERDGLGDAIRDALVASGKDLGALTIEDLAPFDQFHGGGLPFTMRLANLAVLAPGMRTSTSAAGSEARHAPWPSNSDATSPSSTWPDRMWRPDGC